MRLYFASLFVLLASLLLSCSLAPRSVEAHGLFFPSAQGRPLNASWSPRAGHTVASITQEMLVLVGGWTGTGYSNEVFQWSYPLEWSSTSVATGSPLLFTPRAGHCSEYFQNMLWVWGGMGSDGAGGESYFNDIWFSADAGSTWSTTAAPAAWSPRAYASTAQLDRVLYLAGGKPFAADSDPSAPSTMDLWRSEDGITWNLVALAPTSPSPSRRHTTTLGALVSGELHLLGGIANEATDAALTDAWVLDLATGVWVARGNYPGLANLYCRGVVHQGALTIVSGFAREHTTTAGAVLPPAQDMVTWDGSDVFHRMRVSQVLFPLNQPALVRQGDEYLVLGGQIGPGATVSEGLFNSVFTSEHPFASSSTGTNEDHLDPSTAESSSSSATEDSSTANGETSSSSGDVSNGGGGDSSTGAEGGGQGESTAAGFSSSTGSTSGGNNGGIIIIITPGTGSNNGNGASGATGTNPGASSDSSSGPGAGAGVGVTDDPSGTQELSASDSSSPDISATAIILLAVAGSLIVIAALCCLACLWHRRRKGGLRGRGYSDAEAMKRLQRMEAALSGRELHNTAESTDDNTRRMQKKAFSRQATVTATTTESGAPVTVVTAAGWGGSSGYGAMGHDDDEEKQLQPVRVLRSPQPVGRLPPIEAALSPAASGRGVAATAASTSASTAASVPSFAPTSSGVTTSPTIPSHALSSMRSPSTLARMMPMQRSHLRTDSTDSGGDGPTSTKSLAQLLPKNQSSSDQPSLPMAAVRQSTPQQQPPVIPPRPAQAEHVLQQNHMQQRSFSSAGGSNSDAGAQSLRSPLSTVAVTSEPVSRPAPLQLIVTPPAASPTRIIHALPLATAVPPAEAPSDSIATRSRGRLAEEQQHQQQLLPVEPRSTSDAVAGQTLLPASYIYSINATVPAAAAASAGSAPPAEAEAEAAETGAGVALGMDSAVGRTHNPDAHQPLPEPAPLIEYNFEYGEPEDE